MRTLSGTPELRECTQRADLEGIQLSLGKVWVLAQAAIAKYHRLGDLNNRHLFLTVLEAGSPRSKGKLIRFSSEGLLPGFQPAGFWLHPHSEQRETERERESSHMSTRVGGWGETETVFSRVSSYKALIPS